MRWGVRVVIHDFYNKTKNEQLILLKDGRQALIELARRIALDGEAPRQIREFDILVIAFKDHIDRQKLDGFCTINLFEPFDEDEGVWVFDAVPITS